MQNRTKDQETGKRLQARYVARLRAQGVEFRPLTAAELDRWKSGLSMPGFAHICMDGETVVGADA